MITLADLKSVGFEELHSTRHCQFFWRHYMLEGSWCHATASHVLWKGEWNWQVEIWGAVSEPNAPAGAVRQVRLYNPTLGEVEAGLALMRVPGIRVSQDKRGSRVVEAG